MRIFLIQFITSILKELLNNEKLAHTWNRRGLSQLVACVVVVAMAVVVIVVGLGLDARAEVSHIP